MAFALDSRAKPETPSATLASATTDASASSPATGVSFADTATQFSWTWSYDTDADAMSSKPAHFASLKSTNGLFFSSPYEGEQHGTLTLRSHPRWGKDVIVQIERGQVLCSSYDGCDVLVRFDEKPAQTFSATPAADHSTETLFIQNYARFVAGLRAAKRVRISFPVYQEGNPTLDFNVSYFDHAKYQPK